MNCVHTCSNVPIHNLTQRARLAQNAENPQNGTITSGKLKTQDVLYHRFEYSANQPEHHSPTRVALPGPLARPVYVNELPAMMFALSSGSRERREIIPPLVRQSGSGCPSSGFRRQNRNTGQVKQRHRSSVLCTRPEQQRHSPTN